MGWMDWNQCKKKRRHYYNSLSYKVPRSKTNYHLYSYFPRTIRDWNSLPEYVVQALTLASFKQRLPSPNY